MTAICTDKTELNASWNTVSSAWLTRYPNPYSLHVVSADVLERYVDDEGRLYTERLLVKQGRLPRWASDLLNVNKSYILERSVIDPSKQELKSETFNLDHVKILRVIEYSRFIQSSENCSKTIVDTIAKFVSPLRFGLGRRVQKYSLKRFQEQLSSSRRGLLYVIQQKFQPS
ncbi:Intermembrane space protein sorting protein [Schizosaccharomyces pombe]|uniref:Protein ups1 homolog n=1 Tax=Schizosaccharomyces pombe (strain 972 / ATCC 24843) TaxID=284812 RepID=UPS1_SCHPO|nr:putative protein sorting protein [Schizosaccharomyces pombe]Q9UT07.1 RecName: Full=Protein ups1 homolog [Schizosaccharomyces pombe 972h-]CAB55177.1 mitochondrial intermembrane space protein sorting protein (predicted) [Schizosaccharomyces pombe]|eukprot:NP_594949.1 putative protein sorting protein [Schizosaccharomyces pombe]